ncbi:MAG: DUF1127 domain-containing protein [Pseudomonadota bacterium]
MITHTLTLTRLRTLENATRIPPAAALLVMLALQITKWGQRHRSRIALNKLDDHMLRDIGLTPDQARFEADKRFWQR